MIKTEPITANYLRLQRLSTEDGPGTRTTIFLKGCTLQCAWCRSPESIARVATHIRWLEHFCIGCKTCVLSCPGGCISMEDRGLRIDYSRCVLCGKCAEACPANALELPWKKIEAQELSEELLRDKTSFARSGGGVTFSGGEPALQPEFCIALMKILKEQGIHIVLNTCGAVPQENLEMILPYTDLLLYDLKLMNAEQHKQLTGADNERILANLLWIADILRGREYHFTLWIRTPLIPHATADKENLQAIAAFLNQHMENLVERWELRVFNQLRRDQYQASMSRAKLAACQLWASQIYHQPQTVLITGSARAEE